MKKLLWFGVVLMILVITLGSLVKSVGAVTIDDPLGWAIKKLKTKGATASDTTEITRNKEPKDMPLNHRVGLALYFATSGTTPTEDEFLRYAEDHHKQEYDKYHNDEFEWNGRFEKIKKELIELINSIDTTHLNYSIQAKDVLGQYDPARKGFPVGPYKSLFGYTFSPPGSSRITSWEDTIRLFFENMQEFTLLPYPEDKAKVFISKRRSTNGTVDRNIVLLIHFVLYPVKSTEYQKLLLSIIRESEKNEGYVLIGKIKAIEVFENDSLKKKMGFLK